MTNCYCYCYYELTWAEQSKDAVELAQAPCTGSQVWWTCCKGTLALSQDKGLVLGAGPSICLLHCRLEFKIIQCFPQDYLQVRVTNRIFICKRKHLMQEQRKKKWVKSKEGSDCAVVQGRTNSRLCSRNKEMGRREQHWSHTHSLGTSDLPCQKMPKCGIIDFAIVEPQIQAKLLLLYVVSLCTLGHFLLRQRPCILKTFFAHRKLACQGEN